MASPSGMVMLSGFAVSFSSRSLTSLSMKWLVAPVSATPVSVPRVILTQFSGVVVVLQLLSDRAAVEAVALSDLEDAQLLVTTVMSSLSGGKGRYKLLLLSLGVG